MKILASNPTQVNAILNCPYDQTENLLKNDRLLQLNNFSLFYKEEDHGGGLILRHNYLEFLNHTHKKNNFNSCLEWCAGPGFIGFTLLDHNCIQTLDLIDCSQSAIDSCNQTIKNLPDNYIVKAYCDNTVKNLKTKYDLIVGNPPWYSKLLLKENGLNRIYCDLNFNIHKDFFEHVDKLLNKNGRIILVEGLYASHPNDFVPLLNTLEIEQIVKFDNNDFWHDCYFLVLKRKNDS